MKIPAEELELNKLVDKNSEMLYAQIVERIRLWLIKGYLKEGDILPSERELAQMFGVSRMPVSQALKILEFLGVAQYVRGKGVCIKQIDVHYILNNIGFLVMDPQNELSEIYEVRTAIESEAAKLAAERRSQEDLNAIEDALLEMERSIKLKRDSSAPAVRFHMSIIRAAGNDVLVKVSDFLLELISYSAQEALKEVTRQDVALSTHKKIFEAIKDQNGVEASAIMRAHLSQISTMIREA